MNEFYKAELEINFSEWREYQENMSLTQSKRRMMMALWLHMAWGLLRKQGLFINKTFVNTCMVTKDGKHNLKLARVNEAYEPVLAPGSY
jgi:hypothetical protein